MFVSLQKKQLAESQYMQVAMHYQQIAL